ncbi:MAG: radical SAM protein [Elusimicrobia bacterium]|nr:radical SAM protein [Elusimicrobiota bacterium]
MPELNEAAFDAFLAALRRLDYTGYAEQYPPFGSWEDFTGRQADILAAWRKSLARVREAGLFVNIPFCRSRCRFCFLPVTPIGSSGPKRERSFAQYLEALDGEAAVFSPVFKKIGMSTLYIGGGTPSLMTPAETEKFFALLRGRFNIPPGCQVVLELHPDDVTEEKLSAYRACGVNRVCIGAQSLDEGVLTKNARRQGLGRVAAAHAALKAHGISGVNIDLICGLPGQGKASFLKDLRAVMELRPDQVHLNTFINTPYTLHALTGGRAGDERAVEALRSEGFRLLAKAGYHKIDSDSMGLTTGSCNRQTADLSGRRSVLGLGPGAVSRAFGAARCLNRTDWEGYRELAAKGGLPVVKGVLCGPRDEMIYSAITRLTDDLSVNLAEFRRTHGRSFREVFAAEAAALGRAGARFSEGGLKLPRNLWGLVRRVFYRPEVIARGLANLRSARKG